MGATQLKRPVTTAFQNIFNGSVISVTTLVKTRQV
jgi:hypothetical protein